MIDVEPPAPIAVVLAVAVTIHRRCSPFENPLFKWVKVRSLFVFGAPPSSHLPRASQTSGRALAMFLLSEVRRSGSLTSFFTSMPWYDATDVLLLLFLVRRVSLPFSTYLRARDFLEICLLVFWSSLLDLCKVCFVWLGVRCALVLVDTFPFVLGPLW